jgi:hypothetical protein
MSKKARLAKKLRRKMLAVYRQSTSQDDMDQCFCDYLCFGVAGIKTDKEGNTTIASPEEVLDVFTRREVVHEESNNDLFKRYNNKMH